MLKTLVSSLSDCVVGGEGGVVVVRTDQNRDDVMSLIEMSVESSGGSGREWIELLAEFRDLILSTNVVAVPNVGTRRRRAGLGPVLVALLRVWLRVKVVVAERQLEPRCADVHDPVPPRFDR